MILISHRGNILGPNKDKENHPEYIDDAIKLGFNVEVDIWLNDDKFYLGHDEPHYEVNQNWLYERFDVLWVHCKNINALEWFNTNIGFNYFWHEEDTATLTSKNIIWAYPGKQPIKNSIAVMPENKKDDYSLCVGICSDYIQNYLEV